MTPSLPRTGAIALTLIALSLPLDASAQTETAVPINCATAEGDIRALNSEKKYAQDQVVRNVASVTPAGALVGIVTGTEGKRLEMLSGDYEKKIDERIQAIQDACDL
ncbi:MAG: hypothetical protein AAGF94_13275 [Pseudomonadota bacterium]